MTKTLRPSLTGEDARPPLKKLLVCGDGSSPHATFQIGRQKAMEQMLSCFAAYGEPPRAVRPRLQPALHRLADIQIFLLNAITYGNTLLVVLAMCVADVSKIEIENHMAVVNVDWEYQDRVHVAFVAIDHQIWILPEVPGSIALAGRAGRGISIGRNHGT